MVHKRVRFLVVSLFLASQLFRQVHQGLRFDSSFDPSSIRDVVLSPLQQQQQPLPSGRSILFDNVTRATLQRYEPESEIDQHHHNEKKTNLLILASVPHKLQNLVALWTALECLTDDIDAIVVAAPMELHGVVLGPCPTGPGMLAFAQPGGTLLRQ